MNRIHQRMVGTMSPVGGAVAVVLFCTSCMTPFAQSHLTAAADWYDEHARALELYVTTQRGRHATESKEQVRIYLESARIQLANERYRNAWQEMIGCDECELTDCEVKSAKEEIDGLEKCLASMDADRLNLIVDESESYRLVRELRLAQAKHSQAILRARDKCYQRTRENLDRDLRLLDRKFSVVVEQAVGCLDDDKNLSDCFTDRDYDVAATDGKAKKKGDNSALNSACYDQLLGEVRLMDSHLDELAKEKTLFRLERREQRSDPADSADPADPADPVSPRDSSLRACMEEQEVATERLGDIVVKGKEILSQYRIGKSGYRSLDEEESECMERTRRECDLAAEVCGRVSGTD